MTNPVGELNAFELRHLTRHLEAAGRIADLHRLLALDFAPRAQAAGRMARLMRSNTSPELRLNAWYEAKFAADQLDAYVADVRRAWALAEAQSGSTIAARARSPALAAELRYAAIVSSLNSKGAALPVDLLAALVEYGIWSALRALAHARRPGSHEQMQWSEVLDAAKLLQRLAQLGHVELAREAARSLPDPVTRAGGLAAVGPTATEALSVTDSIADSDQRARAVTAMAPYLDEDEAGFAAALLKPFPAGGDGGWAVRAIAARMAEIGCGTKAVELVFTPRSVADDGEVHVDLVVVCRAVEEMAEHLEAHDVRDLLDRVAAPELADTRAEVLTALAPHLPLDALDAARALADTVDGESARARLRSLLVDGDPATLRRRALAAAAGHDREDRWYVLVCIASRRHGALRQRLLADAARAAVRSQYRESRGEDLLSVLEVSGPALRRRFAGEALKHCRRIDEPFRRSHALERLAALVDEPLRAQVLGYALSAAENSGVKRQAQLVGLVGRQATLRLLSRLQSVGSDGSEVACVALRAWLAPDVETLLVASVGAARVAVDQAAAGVVAQGHAAEALRRLSRRRVGDLADALAALVRHLPEDQLQAGIRAVDRARPAWLAARAHAALAARLVEAGRAEEGYRRCRTLLEAPEKGGVQFVAEMAVDEVAPLLAQAGRLDLAEELCETRRDVYKRVQLLAACAGHAERAAARRLLERTLAAVDADDRDVYVTEFAGPLVRHGLLDIYEALRRARASSKPVEALVQLAPLAAPPRRDAILAEARRLARTAYELHRNRATLLDELRQLIEVACGEDHDELLDEYLAEIDEATRTLPSTTIAPKPLDSELWFLATHLAAHGGPRSYEVWRRALHELSSDRKRLLWKIPELAPLCAVLAAGDELVYVVEDVCAWWP